MVRDVVAEVRHRRRIDGRDPDRVHTQPDQVVEAGANALEIADAVAVRVQERARIDLINDPALPPFEVRSGVHDAPLLLETCRSREAPRAWHFSPLQAGHGGCYES